MTRKRHFANRCAGALLCTCALTLVGCSDESFDVQSQIGPNPNLPEQTQYLFPPMHMAPLPVLFFPVRDYPTGRMRSPFRERRAWFSPTEMISAVSPAGVR